MTFTNVPAKLKSADILRFAQRAGQVEKVKPVISYWCYYWILNQILAKQLQSADAECSQYAGNLMDTLEQMKTQNASEDAVNDDLAGQTYVERFGLETFQRADNAVRANRVSKQTAETFRAASTFLELLQIWSPLSQEVNAKIKYGNYHALRILRATKAGEDPNLSNPVPEVPIDAEEVTLDPDDPEVQKINGAAYQQPSVEDEDSGEIGPRIIDGPPTYPTEQPHQDQAHLPSNTTGVPPKAPIDDYSPLPAIFPRDPATAPSDPPSIPPSPSAPEDPATFYSTPPPPNAAAPPPPQPGPHPRQPAPPSPAYAPPPERQVPSQPTAAASYDAGADDVAVAEAQKHARWAISALNFEDVGTAVAELRLALKTLGAS